MTDLKVLENIAILLQACAFSTAALKGKKAARTRG
jgi:hypothetical protein